ncbi:hypothetical protein [Pseudomonas sp. ZB1P45]
MQLGAIPCNPKRLFTARSSAQSHTFHLPTSNYYGPEKLDLIGEVGMSSDSSFQDQTQGSVPSKPESGSDEPTLDPDDPNKYDPLTKPSDDRPEDWKEPGERTTPEADEITPLSDDMR